MAVNEVAARFCIWKQFILQGKKNSKRALSFYENKQPVTSNIFSPGRKKNDGKLKNVAG